MDSDESFMVYRRFGTVCARLLLNKQDEIAGLEKAIIEMDDADGNDSERTSCLMSRDIDGSTPPDREKWPKSRQEILGELESRVLEYSVSNHWLACI